MTGAIARRRNSGRRPDAERGFILVVVLAMTLMLALMAAAFAHAVRGHLRTVTAIAASAEAEALADGAIALVRADLARHRADPSAQRRFATDGTSLSCRMDGDGWVTVSATDEAGKINLNTSNDALLRALVRGLVANEDEAEAALDSLLDFRDGDSDKRDKGAEAPDYLAALGRETGLPKNAPFDAVDELDQVLGLPPEFAQRAKPWVTVHTTLSGIDPEAAHPMLVAILTAGAEDGPAIRATADAAFQDLAPTATLPPSLTARSDQTSFTLRAVGHAGTRGRFVREAVIEWTAATGEPRFVVRRWRQGATGAGDDAPARSVSLPPC